MTDRTYPLTDGYSIKIQTTGKRARMIGAVLLNGQEIGITDNSYLTISGVVKAAMRVVTIHKDKIAAQAQRCAYCNRPMRYRYPGNDPECGPARLSCGFQWCDQARESIEWAKRYSLTTATMDQIHAEALEENSIADMYPDNLCENCGA